MASVKKNRLNVYRLLRIARDRKTKEIAAALGVTAAYINAIESGLREPSLDKISLYARALDVDENTLFALRSGLEEYDRFEPALLFVLESI